MEKIGIYGGTFNPIHNAHLIIAEQAREIFKLDKVVFVPSANPPHKVEMVEGDNRNRLNLVRLAVQSNKYFEVSDVEYQRVGYSYTKDTLAIFKEKIKNSCIYFIGGGDIVFDVLGWKNPEEIFGLCEFIIVKRPGFDRSNFETQLKYLKDNYGAVINVCKTTSFDLSSTVLRERIANKQSIKYLVPEKVERYIHINNMYNE